LIGRKGRRMSFSEAANFIRQRQRFLITSHVNPDGDGIGAMMGLERALRKLGKEGIMILEAEPPKIFSFLPEYDRLKSLADFQHAPQYDAAILVDSPTLERVGKVADFLKPDIPMLNLDHHVSNQYFAPVNLVEPTFSSSAEMVYRLVVELGLAPDSGCAECLYTGIIIDTGRFRFSNTSPDTLRAAAALVAAGARPDIISEKIYEKNTLETTRALGKFIASLSLELDGKAAVGSFENEFITSEEYQRVETEGFVNHALSIEGVEVAAFLKEVEKGKTRASLRSRGGMDVNKLAGAFGGGGHSRAAGCTIMAPMAQAKAQLLEQMAKRLG